MELIIYNITIKRNEALTKIEEIYSREIRTALSSFDSESGGQTDGIVNFHQ